MRGCVDPQLFYLLLNIRRQIKQDYFFLTALFQSGSEIFLGVFIFNEI